MRLALTLAATLALAGPALARSFDGSWGIEVMTEQGRCDPRYLYYIVIRDNAVHLRSMMGETSPQAAGRVGPGGRIDGTLGAADDPVAVRGQLESVAGSGTWAAPSRGCSGRWVAEKRG